TLVTIRPGMINPRIIASPNSLILLVLMIVPPHNAGSLSKQIRDNITSLPLLTLNTPNDLQLLLSTFACG
ncbi:MAG: hypothetical protein ACWGO2_11505, partial [Syntrophobacteria bacterium]